MNMGKYLPSAQFTTVVVSLGVAVGLVYAAQYVSGGHQPPTLSAQVAPSSQDNWQQTLAEVQASSGVSLPQPPSQDTVNQLLTAAQTANLTDTLGRSVFANLAIAKSQGLGDDAPTQDAISSQAANLTATTTAPTYGVTDLTVVPSTRDSLHAYGNAIIEASLPYTLSADAVLVAVGYTTDYQDANRLVPVKEAATSYKAYANALVHTPVPETLVPLHLKAVNDFAAMAQYATNLEQVLTDPALGLTSLQQFEATSNDAKDVFTTIAKSFNTDGILFTKDEPGASWSALLSAANQ